MSVFLNPTFTTIVNNISNEIIIKTGTVLLQNSIQNIVANALAKELSYMYGKIDYGYTQIDPGTKTGIALDSFAKLAGVYRNSAGTATGVVVFTGTAGTTIPDGTQLIRSDGFIYETTEAGTVGSNITITATDAGIDGNAASGTQLIISPAIAGLDNTVTTSNAISGGSDVEDDDSLRARMYAEFQTVPSGGSPADHVNWIDAVSGVVQAWVNPVPSQGNLVTCYVMFAATNGNNGFPTGTDGGSSYETRIPTATGDLLAVADAVYPDKPVGEIMYLAAPISTPINITVTGLTGLTSTLQTEIQTALATYIRSIATPLGTTVYIASLESVIANTASTTSFTMTAPAANVPFTMGQFPALGNLNFSS